MITHYSLFFPRGTGVTVIIQESSCVPQVIIILCAYMRGTQEECLKDAAPAVTLTFPAGQGFTLRPGIVGQQMAVRLYLLRLVGHEAVATPTVGAVLRKAQCLHGRTDFLRRQVERRQVSDVRQNVGRGVEVATLTFGGCAEMLLDNLLRRLRPSNVLLCTLSTSSSSFVK